MRITDKFEVIQIGDEAEIWHTITEKDVSSFVDLTGDNNPLHVDENFASNTTLKKRVVHGMLTASFISTVIGTKLPGSGSLWYEQQMRFLSPVRIGGKIRVWAKVRHKSFAQRILVLETIVFDEQGERVIEGEAKVKILKQEKKKELTMFDQNKGAIIVSGASRGIGASIAKALAREGYPVFINFYRSRDQAESLVKEIIEEQGQATLCKADVSNKKEVKKMVDLARSSSKYIHGIVNNASGPIEIRDFVDLTWKDMQRHLDIQLKGAFNLTQSVLDPFLEQESGVIVNIASVVTDNVPPAKWLPYNIAKSAIVTFTKSIASEYGSKGIRSNCVSPGMTQTDMIADLPEKAKMLAKMQTPLRRLATSEDIANTVAYLFSERSSFITGQNIRVCGGLVMP